MKLLVATFVSVYAITFAATPTLGAGWFWDIGNGLGFAAFSGLLFLALSSARPLNLRVHRHAAYAVLAIALGHAFWFLLGDAAAAEFLKPGAPVYMWLGLVSLMLLLALITVAVPPDRQRVHRDHARFRSWHLFMTIATVTAALYHIAASGFYLGSGYQVAVFTGLALCIFLGRPAWNRLPPAPPSATRSLVSLSACLTILFAAIRNIPS